MKYWLIAPILIGTFFSAYTEDKKEHNDEAPIDLTADDGFYDQKKGMAVYEGNVVVIQADMTLWSDKLKVTLKNNVAELIEADGKPARFEYKGDTPPITGHAEHIQYEVSKDLVTLTGDAVIIQGDDVVKGKILTYDLTKETVGGSKVKMRFLPAK